MTLTSSINRMLRKTFGLEIHKTLIDFDETRYKFLLSEKVTLLVDGGANEGQYATRVRNSGFPEKFCQLSPIQ